MSANSVRVMQQMRTQQMQKAGFFTLLGARASANNYA